MDEVVDSTFELPRLNFRWFAVVPEAPRALLRPLEATSLARQPPRAAPEATRSHREALLSSLEAAKTARERSKTAPRGLQEICGLEKTQEN